MDAAVPSQSYFAVDWAIPDRVLRNADGRRRARLFVTGCLAVVPPMLAVAISLGIADPQPSVHFWIVVAGILGVLVYPVLLRATAALTVLSLVLIEQLTLTLLFGAYHYGGAVSPLLCWLLVVPLLALLCFAEGTLLRALALGGLLVRLVGFYVLASRFDVPHHVSQTALAGAALVSVISAAAFVAVITVYYTRIGAALQVEHRHETVTRRITEIALLEARDDAVRAKRAKSAFLAKMSHELRTPLNAIIGFAQIIGSEMLGPIGVSKYAAYSADIERSGQHLLHLIDDILDTAGIESGQVRLQEAAFELLPLVAGAAQVLEPLAGARGIAIRLDAAVSALRLHGDHLRIRQILLNLLSNAVKFSHRGDVVSVTVERVEALGVAVSVADTGIGMRAGELAHAAEPFAQLGDPMTESSSGAGLGLSLARELAALHGGSLTLASEPDRGTVATLHLPESRILTPRPPLTLLQGSKRRLP